MVETTTRAEAYRLMWKIKALHRLKTFMWLVMNDAFLTNYSHFKRGMVANDLCIFCGIYSKTMFHALHDCEILKVCGKALEIV